MDPLHFPDLDDLLVRRASFSFGNAALKSTSDSINRIVDLIPSQHWFVADHQENLESRFHKHKKQVLDVTKTKSNATKKAKLDLTDSRSVTARQQAMFNQAAAHESEESSADDSHSDEEDVLVNQVEEQSVTVSERRAQLEAARQPTNPKRILAKSKKSQAPEDKSMKRQTAKKKQKTQHAIDKAKKMNNDGQIINSNEQPEIATDSQPCATHHKTVDSVTEDIQFGTIEFGDEKKNKKGPSNKDVKAQFLKAQNEKTRLAELAISNPEKASAITEKQVWKRAMMQASGEKVKDDPKLLSRAVKRKEKDADKRKSEWNKRTQLVEKDLVMRNKKRNENILKKIDASKSKKIKKLKKRK